ncbi:DNA repair protein RecO [Mycoplasma iguanae]|uniref:DNA repair protein RecO n=1 Tax=Mycoplasma iguanae TaxID=292461 RepID=A0ABY5R7X6_9MOLU|nr:DNA repair protein RecO [Mycoplasma iguanae]UVD81589.1 DNA repair protein RecO [Mycoplasma iguanae]
MEKIVRGIVINQQNYRDFDLIVKILTPQRIYSVFAPGVRKMESKNRYGLILGTYGEFEIFASPFKNKMSKLKKANALVNFDIQNQNNLKIAGELFKQLNRLEKINSKFFSLLEKHWPDWGTENNEHLLTYIVMQILELHGLKPSFKGCVECGTIYYIASFSFLKGGFLCQLHKTKKIATQKLYGYYFLEFDLKRYFKEIDFKTNREIYLELQKYLNQNLY